MKKQLILTITFGYATLFSIPLMAMHEERACLEPIDINSFIQTIRRWKTHQAQLTAIKTGVFAAGVGASYFYFRPEMRTIQNIMTCALGVFGITGLIYRLKRSSLLTQRNENTLSATVLTHNIWLDNCTRDLVPLSTEALHSLPFGDPDNPNSRASIYQYLIETDNENHYGHRWMMDRIVNKYRTKASILQMNRLEISDEFLNQMSNRYDFFAPIVATIERNRNAISNLSENIMKWSNYIVATPEYEIEQMRDELINGRENINKMAEAFNALLSDDPDDDEISQCYKIGISLLHDTFYEALNIQNEKALEHNKLYATLNTDMQKLIMEQTKVGLVFCLDKKIELPKSIGNEEE